MGYTSIQIMPQTRKRLSSLKEDGRQTYDTVLNRLMALVPSGDDEGEYSDEFRIGLLNARIQLRARPSRSNAIGMAQFWPILSQASHLMG